MFADRCYPRVEKVDLTMFVVEDLLDQVLLEVRFEHLRIFLVLYDTQLVHLKEAVLPYVCPIVLERYNKPLVISPNPISMILIEN